MEPAKGARRHDVRPNEVIKDERLPAILQSLRQATFVTIDDWFWDRARRNRRYCIIFVALREDEQRDVPVLVRKLFRLPEFRTRAARMGKAIRLSRERVTWWQPGEEHEYTTPWAIVPSRRTRG